eukprot:TRINITY_DN4453_c0_g1_i1.p1 TRINITY_DN4453_c0_g1~~TRINITY_DN4453_c0_g1_i1.p1  ORF type:complete len:289 (-),score=33.53 TRINITY_DN4453_c0_g1_i1:61-927(-)
MGQSASTDQGLGICSCACSRQGQFASPYVPVRRNTMISPHKVGGGGNDSVASSHHGEENDNVPTTSKADSHSPSSENSNPTAGAFVEGSSVVVSGTTGPSGSASPPVTYKRSPATHMSPPNTAQAVSIGANFGQPSRFLVARKSAETMASTHFTKLPSVPVSSRASGNVNNRPDVSSHRTAGALTPASSESNLTLQKSESQTSLLGASFQSDNASVEVVVCPKCSNPILPGDHVEKVFGHTFHKACFCCYGCGKKFRSPKSVVPVNGSLYCDQCGRKAFISMTLGNKG